MYEVSHVIPVFNGETTIAEAIESVLGQTLPPRELIVVDDGSIDGTRNEVGRFRDRIVYRRQENAGVSAARNHGLRIAKGDWLAFLDADDRVHPDKLALQLAAARRRPELELCDGHARYFWSEELSDEQRESDRRYRHDFWKRAAPGHIDTWLARRDLFERFGFFDENLDYSEDTDWYLRVRDGGAILETLPEILAYRRLHRGNITARDRAGQTNGIARAIKSSLDRRRGRL